MQIKQPGMFTRGKILIGRPAPHISAESLVIELQHAWGPRGFEVYRSSLIGADVALKKSGWTGIVFKIKHEPQGTEILYNAYAPSAFVRLMFMGAIPILITSATAWKPLLRAFEDYVRTSAYFTGHQLAGAGPAALPQAVAHYPHGAPPPAYGQRTFNPPPPGAPCGHCGTPMQWVPQENRWYCGRCQQLR